jgi:retron-type reverse transcriptase
MASLLFKTILSWENLLDAYRKASRHKRGKGAAARFEHQLADHLLQLQNELTARTYQPGEYVSFMIHDPKLRKISAAPFRDRVIHHALCNQIEPLFERRFIFDSYANRVGKGTHRAVDRLQFLRNVIAMGYVAMRFSFFQVWITPYWKADCQG